MSKRLNLYANAWLWLMLVSFAGAQAQTPNVSATPQVRPVKGGGTAGQLPKWISADTIEDSIVVESNGNIGIGTSTPGSKLTVAGRIEAFTTGFIPAVLGQSPGGSGVRGNSDTGFGVFGSSTTGNGAQGLSNSGNGLFGFSLTGNGVRGDTGNSSTAGVLGVNSASGGHGVLGQAFNGTGVRGISSTSFGVFGSSDLLQLSKRGVIRALGFLVVATPTPASTVRATPVLASLVAPIRTATSECGASTRAAALPSSVNRQTARASAASAGTASVRVCLASIARMGSA